MASNTKDIAAHYLFELAEANEANSPNIGGFRVTDGLKAHAVGLINGTAERLNGKSMTGISKTLERVGRGLESEHGRNGFAIRPVYKTDPLGSTIYTARYYQDNGDITMAPTPDTLDSFGFKGRVVYSTCDLDPETGEVASYHPVNTFKPEFLTDGMRVYIGSNHCRADEWVYHVEMLRGQLALWAAAPQMEDTSTKYTKTLINLAGDRGYDYMIDKYSSDLRNAGLESFVLS